MQQRDAQLPKAYTFSEVEDKLYAFWESKGFFHAQANPSRRPYTIVIPPPNITGILHAALSCRGGFPYNVPL